MKLSRLAIAALGLAIATGCEINVDQSGTKATTDATVPTATSAAPTRKTALARTPDRSDSPMESA